MPVRLLSAVLTAYCLFLSCHCAISKNASDGVALHDSAKSGTAATKIIKFPKNVSLGVVSYLLPRKSGLIEEFYAAPSVRIGPAQGDVVVPAGSLLSLRCGYALTEHPELLAQVNPAVFASVNGLRLPIQDGICEPLSKMANLLRLQLEGTDVTDAGARKLAKIPNLRNLMLDETGVTGAFLTSFTENKTLLCLKLATVPFTIEGWKAMAHLRQLQELDINRCKLSDEGLKYIGQLTELRILRMSDNSLVTDDGIKYLKSCKHLISLKIERILISVKGLNQLKALLITELRISGDIKGGGLGAVKKIFPQAQIAVEVRHPEPSGDARDLYAPLK